MGLLALFSKKSYSDLTERDSLKTSAYDAAVALSPPIRGSYPVLGNGSKILEQFQRSHPNLANITHNSTPARSPILPRFRIDGSYGSSAERPSTAPSSQPGGTAGSLSLQSQPTSRSSQPSGRKYGPYKLPPKVATDIQASSIPFGPARSPGLVSTYSDSARSGESSRTKGYVDLLDAQSRIKPSDFYGRVQATGVKIYGEDVADRNRRENGPSHDTTKARGSPSDHVDAKWTSVISKDVDDDSDDELPRRPRIRHSVSSGLRSRYTSSHTTDSFPKRTSSRLPPRDVGEMPKAMSRTASARSERAARRKSMPSFTASVSPDLPRNPSSTRKSKGKDLDDFPISLRNRARAATVYEQEHTRANRYTKRQLLGPSHVEHESYHDFEKPLPALPPSRDLSRRRSVTHHNALVESRLLAKRQSLQSIHPLTRGEIYEDTYQKKISLQGAQLPKDRSPARRQLGSTTDLQDSFYNLPDQQPDHKSQITPSPANDTDNERQSGNTDHFRKQSMISLSSTSIKAHDIESTVPKRSSSLGHFRDWSLTSETATSTISSNPFRPQSGHTTSTSIDFSPMFPHENEDQSIPPVPDIPSWKSLQSMPREASVMPLPTPSRIAFKRQSSEFYLEDYASSNGGSTTPSRGSYEKDLLFSETDYGTFGHQTVGLPGLFDAATPASSTDLSTRQVPGDEIHGVSRLLRFPAFPNIGSHVSPEDQEQTYSSDDSMNFDIPKNRAGPTLRRTPALDQLSADKQSAGEEDGDSDF
ncbi:hypothetical protein NUW58_g1657 [Xylaria curta]|uniref:Uncharacterized protein n=1 Tax=Xylaria curta TaxID=42375 RepID=A0ACC1PKU0_9PEZI|nr:hypothetical protein NUW58_g1657 [Xylaria curta]